MNKIEKCRKTLQNCFTEGEAFWKTKKGKEISNAIEALIGAKIKKVNEKWIAVLAQNAKEMK